MFEKPYSRVTFFGMWADDTCEAYGLRDALAVLDDVLARCRDQDMRTDDTAAALAWLDRRCSKGWKIEAFRRALDEPDPLGRVAAVRSALIGLRKALGVAV